MMILFDAHLLAFRTVAPVVVVDVVALVVADSTANDLHPVVLRMVVHSLVWYQAKSMLALQMCSPLVIHDIQLSGVAVGKSKDKYARKLWEVSGIGLCLPYSGALEDVSCRVAE